MKVVENCKKEFTNKKRNNIISLKHSLLSENCEDFYEREGLFMIRTKEGVLKKSIKELSKKYNQREKFIKLLTKICIDFEVSDYKIIEKFLKNKEKSI